MMLEVRARAKRKRKENSKFKKKIAKINQIYTGRLAVLRKTAGFYVSKFLPN